MDGCGPDDVGPEELKRAKAWREVRAELSKGVNPKWSGASTRNTRLWKASLERKRPGAKDRSRRGERFAALAVYDGSADETALIHVAPPATPGKIF